MLYRQLPEHGNVPRKSRTGIAASSSLPSLHRYLADPVADAEMNIRYNVPSPRSAPSSDVVGPKKGMPVGAKVKVCDIENGGIILDSFISEELRAGYYGLEGVGRVSEVLVFPSDKEDDEIQRSLSTLIRYTSFNRSLPRSHKLPQSFPGYGEKTMGGVTNPVASLQGLIPDIESQIVSGGTVEERKRSVALVAARTAYSIVTKHYFLDGNGRNAIYSIYDILDRNQFYLRRTPIQVHAFLLGESDGAYDGERSNNDINAIAEWIYANMTHQPKIQFGENEKRDRKWFLPNRQEGIRELEKNRQELKALQRKLKQPQKKLNSLQKKRKEAELRKLRDWKKYSELGNEKLRKTEEET